VLADFGLATHKNEKKLIYKKCGTPGFVAPEILKYKDGGEFYDEKCDIFSTGIIFYYL
jgi:serine/threonine protein kinase